MSYQSATPIACRSAPIGAFERDRRWEWIAYMAHSCISQMSNCFNTDWQIFQIMLPTAPFDHFTNTLTYIPKQHQSIVLIDSPEAILPFVRKFTLITQCTQSFTRSERLIRRLLNNVLLNSFESKEAGRARKAIDLVRCPSKRRKSTTTHNIDSVVSHGKQCNAFTGLLSSN